MTIHAYSKLYVNDATKNLAVAFDYAINDCKLEIDWFSQIFSFSYFANQFENGNIYVISGISGIELVQKILHDVYLDNKFPLRKFRNSKSKEYWAGWVLSQYQWVSKKRFKDIFKKISLSEIIKLYPIYHEMDISQFIDFMDGIFKNSNEPTKLSKIRELRNLSQKELADLSNVNIRSIQLYEQKVNDINKAQSITLYKLASVLACNIEDLLE